MSTLSCNIKPGVKSTVLEIDKCMVGLASASAALETVKIVMLNVWVQNGRKAHWGFCETRAFWRDGLGNSKLQ